MRLGNVMLVAINIYVQLLLVFEGFIIPTWKVGSAENNSPKKCQKYK